MQNPTDCLHPILLNINKSHHLPLGKEGIKIIFTLLQWTYNLIRVFPSPLVLYTLYVFCVFYICSMCLFHFLCTAHV